MKFFIRSLVFAIACTVAYLSGEVLRAPRILHLSFHQGCINDFAEVARQLGIECTSWYILAADRERTHFDGVTTGNAVYNITHERAERVWNKHKDYFDQFDCIVTSDTAPLSRIFLQNGWKKPLIIWVCNRFDYADAETAGGTFPDHEYYDLIKRASMMANVRLVPYTDYEGFYAWQRGIDLGATTICPIGISLKEGLVSSKIPASIDKEEMIFIYPRLSDAQMRYAVGKCLQRKIPTYTGIYNGPDDLAGFKGILYFPYAWSNIALFENLARGIVHFVPTFEFVMREAAQGSPVRIFTRENHELCEWYKPEHEDLFVFFDSWDDLAQKMKTAPYEEIARRGRVFAERHREKMLDLWRATFNQLFFR